MRLETKLSCVKPTERRNPKVCITGCPRADCHGVIADRISAGTN